ncbi:hypothetical protein Tco_0994791, partial [Tanacetum coccineum]
KDELRKAYEEWRDIPMEQRALIEIYLKIESELDYAMHNALFKKAAKLEKQIIVELSVCCSGCIYISNCASSNFILASKSLQFEQSPFLDDPPEYVGGVDGPGEKIGVDEVPGEKLGVDEAPGELISR